MTQIFNIFITLVYPALIIVTGIASNLMIFAIYSRKRFKKSATKNIWRFLAVVDLISILLFSEYFLQNCGLDISIISQFVCKFLNFINFFKTISAWIITFISIERFFSILYPQLSKRLRRKKTQLLVCSFISIVNVVFYSQLIFFVEMKKFSTTIVTNNTSNKTNYRCVPYDISSDYFKAFSFMDLIISSLLPFAIMFICSIILINSIYNSRKRLASKISKKESKQIKKDVRFSMCTILMDVLFFACTFPIEIARLIWIDIASDFFALAIDLYHTQFIDNFFIYLTVNTIFRDEFLIMFHFK
jgi:hypothetical protein